NCITIDQMGLNDSSQLVSEPGARDIWDLKVRIKIVTKASKLQQAGTDGFMIIAPMVTGAINVITIRRIRLWFMGCKQVLLRVL
nr:hypothetical protein [Tanacetum cinerariifolium]